MRKQEWYDYSYRYLHQECIYREGRILCCARVRELRACERLIVALLEVVPRPGFLPWTLKDWVITCDWQHFSFDQERWSAACTGLVWQLHFHPSLVDRMLDTAMMLPEELDSRQRRFLLGRYLTDMDWEYLRNNRNRK
jgi:hypothetical protein